MRESTINPAALDPILTTIIGIERVSSAAGTTKHYPPRVNACPVPCGPSGNRQGPSLWRMLIAPRAAWTPDSAALRSSGPRPCRSGYPLSRYVLCASWTVGWETHGESGHGGQDILWVRHNVGDRSADPKGWLNSGRQGPRWRTHQHLCPRGVQVPKAEPRRHRRDSPKRRPGAPTFRGRSGRPGTMPTVGHGRPTPWLTPKEGES